MRILLIVADMILVIAACTGESARSGPIRPKLMLPPRTVGAAKDRLGGQVFLRQITLPGKGNTKAMTGTVRPYSKHVYRFSGRGGQELTVQLNFQTEGLEGHRDLMFWIQCRKWYPPGLDGGFLTLSWWQHCGQVGLFEAAQVQC